MGASQRKASAGGPQATPRGRGERRRPRLLAVGLDSETGAVATALGSLRVRVVRCSWDALDWQKEADATGYLLVGLAALAAVRAGLKARVPFETVTPPVFVVAGDDAGERSVRELYRLGVAGVFLWPRESLLLPRYLAEMLALRQVRGKARRPDTALQRVVRTRLRMVRGASPVPRVRVWQGIVEVSGQVPTLAIRNRIEDAAAAVAGVVQLDVSGLCVVPLPVSNAELRKRAQRLLQAVDAIDPGTIAVNVDRGSVTLSGSVQSKAALRQLCGRIAQLEGVRSLDVHVVPSPRQAHRDHHLARRLNALTRDIFGDESDVHVAFFGGAAVLQGEVGSLEAKRSIAAFVDEHPAVDRIVNKLSVRR